MTDGPGSTSVIVSTLNRPDALRECLVSLAAQTTPPDEVVVVADGDADETEAVVAAAECSPVRVVRGPGRGLPASRNVGVSEATGDILCFVDDDVVLPPNWLAELLGTYRTHDVDGVGGLVVNYNPEGVDKADTTDWSYRLLTSLRYLLFHDRVGEVGPMGALYAPHTFNTTGTKPVDTLQGCNMTYKSHVFEDRRFDEWYGLGGSAPAEELDLCTRIVRDGGTLLFAPRAVAVHKRDTAGGERGDTDRSFRNFRNMAYYNAEYSRHRARDVTLLVLHSTLAAVGARTLDPLRMVARGVWRAAGPG